MVNLKALLCGVLLLSVAAGQQVEPRTYPQRVTAGLRATITAPVMRWHWAVTGVGILAALPLDSGLQGRAEDQGLMPEPLARLGDDWGGKWAAIGILPGIYVVESLKGTPRGQTFQRLDFAFTSLALVGITTEVIKYTVRRPRPNRVVLPFPYGHSFPSGHTSLAFGVAEVVRSLYGNLPGGFFYGLALVTGISRIHDNKHYLSDVVAGAGLGIGLVRGFAIAMLGDDSGRVLVSLIPGGVKISIPLR